MVITVEVYPVARAVHLTTVGVTITLFALRGYWMLRGSGMLRRPWVRTLPHVNDTFLLGSAIVLAYITQQAPWAHSWLAAKLVGLLVYIGLGMVALRAGRSRSARILAWVAAIGVFAYIVTVALTRQPFPRITPG